MTGILVIPMSVHVTLLQQRLNGLHSASWQYKNMHECAHPLPPTHTHSLARTHEHMDQMRQLWATGNTGNDV